MGKTQINEARLKFDTAIPLYYQLKEVVRQQIEEGIWQIGDLIPTEQQLQEKYRISRSTVRQAINELVNEGYLVKKQGKGTFVAKPKLQEKFVQRTYGFYQEMEEKGFEVESKILEHKLIEPPTRVRTLLKLSEGQKIVKTSRLRSVNKELIMLTTTYVRSDLCPGLEKEDLTNRSLYQLLWEKYGIKIAYGYRTLEAVAASKYEADMLKVPKGSPVVYLESISYLGDGIPIEYFEAWHRGDRCKFAIELVPAEEMKKVMPVYKKDFTFWFGMPSEEVVSSPNRTDK